MSSSNITPDVSATGIVPPAPDVNTPVPPAANGLPANYTTSSDDADTPADTPATSVYGTSPTTT